MYKHWKNRGEPLDMVFFTTTVLDFVPVFKRTELADEMARIIVGAAAQYGARLHAFVVMPEHVHFLVRLPEHLNAIQYGKRLKSYSATRLIPKLTQGQQRMFDQQRGLNGRSFWQVSFRSRVIESSWRFRVAVRYIHRNPAKRGLCEYPEEYRWSSAWMDEAGLWQDGGLVVRPWPEWDAPPPPARVVLGGSVSSGVLVVDSRVPQQQERVEG